MFLWEPAAKEFHAYENRQSQRIMDDFENHSISLEGIGHRLILYKKNMKHTITFLSCG